MDGIRLDDPNRPWENRARRRRRMRTIVPPRNASLRSHEALAHLEAQMIMAGIELRTGPYCHYCAPGSGYEIPPGGCPCSQPTEADYVNEMRAAIVADGLSYSASQPIISVR